MSRYLVLAITALIGACATENSKAPTSESWVQLTPQQAVAPLQPEIDVYAEQESRPVRMDRNGCSTSIVKTGDIIQINRVHPREVYCIGIAPLRLAMIELPAGTQLTGLNSGMMEFMSVTDADAGGRRTISIQAKCTPLRKDDEGKPIPAEIHKQNLMTQSALPYCPRPSTDLVLMTSDGPITMNLSFNETSRTRVVDIRNDPELTGHRPRIPRKPAYARDLYATSLDGAIVPWVPDDAWYTGEETVIIWHRPMPTLPGIHIGTGGEMLATPPTIINAGQAIAMVYPRVLTEFQLRMDDRILQFSAGPLTDEQKDAGEPTQLTGAIE
jgi:hypothetical protein